MNPKLLPLLLAAPIGCAEPAAPGSSQPTRLTADWEAPATSDPQPWEQATATDESVSGAFSVQLGDEMPGGGWFTTGDVEARSFARGAVHQVEDARWPVISLRILGRDGDDWNSLEIDIALNHQVAGSVPLDGEAAVGLLSLADGTRRYLLDEQLQLTEAGFEQGQRVAGSFDDVPLWEVP